MILRLVTSCLALLIGIFLGKVVYKNWLLPSFMDQKKKELGSKNLLALSEGDICVHCLKGVNPEHGDFYDRRSKNWWHKVCYQKATE